MGFLSFLNPFSWFREEEEIHYPNDFAIIMWSKHAQELGVFNDRNKIIYRYFINRYGNSQIRKYRYSEARVKALKEIHRIPIYDKTKSKQPLPIFARIMPGEVSYVQAR